MAARTLARATAAATSHHWVVLAAAVLAAVVLAVAVLATDGHYYNCACDFFWRGAEISLGLSIRRV